MIFSDSSFNTGRLEIGVLEKGWGFGNGRRRAAGVETVEDEIYFGNA
jgi:hypothetical protein